MKIPIIGMGGIATVTDAIEFIIAGANAVQIGTANFVEPLLWQTVIDGINGYLDRHQFATVGDLVGQVTSRK